MEIQYTLWGRDYSRVAGVEFRALGHPKVTVCQEGFMDEVGQSKGAYRIELPH